MIVSFDLRRIVGLASIGCAILSAPTSSSASASSPSGPALSSLPPPIPRATGWRDAGLLPIRGITIGPIENALHPGVGYGTEACGRAMDLAVDLGATWVAITPFGRMWSNRVADVDLEFEAPFDDNREAVGRAIDQAHARNLRVMLVPHLWMIVGGWRGEIEPFSPPDVKDAEGHYLFRGRADEAAMRRFAASYETFVDAWADVAEAHGVELLSLGVELRSWVTSGRATDELRALVADVRGRYHGLLTYSANWDDVDDAWFLSSIDVIGINAFYPLADVAGAGHKELMDGGARVAGKVHALADAWHKPVLFTEVGYTARPDPAVRPWEWPETMHGVRVDEHAQAEAYRALLSGVLDDPTFAGFFAWRMFADPNDVSQEAAWGFPVLGKEAELVLRDVFASRWAGDPWSPTWALIGDAAQGFPGVSWRWPVVRALPFEAGEVAPRKLRTYPAAR